MATNLAPIGLSAYGRLQHLQQTVAALQKNDLARESELFVFSDAPKPGDEERVEAVRRYLRSVDGFKAIHILERAVNDRVANNRGGIRMLLNEYGRMIFLEEDIVTAPSFLSFMNEALETYGNDPRIFAINAYTPPLKLPEDYQSPVILLPRFAAWGFGIWKEKFDEIVMNITPEMFLKLRRNRDRLKEFCMGGDDVITQLWLQANGYINALDVMIDYAMFIKGRQYVLCPAQSLSHSTGCDGSGEHWDRPTEKYAVVLDAEHAEGCLRGTVLPDERIIEQLRQFYRLSKQGMIAKYLIDMGLYPGVLKIRRYLKNRWSI